MEKCNKHDQRMYIFQRRNDWVVREEKEYKIKEIMTEVYKIMTVMKNKDREQLGAIK